jgi:hypothetical protein
MWICKGLFDNNMPGSIYVCMCVCVCVYIYIYINVCVCECVCVRVIRWLRIEPKMLPVK